VTVPAVLQLIGAVEEDSLFRLCDAIVDRDAAGALVQIEELAEQGQDLGRLVTDLLEHLRHLLLVQHVGHVPASLPVTDETRERLREQANQLPEPTVLRLIDLLAVAVDDQRRGADPRLPLELALVKVTRPQVDLQRESLAHRVELLEQRVHLSPGSHAAPSGPQASAPPGEAGSKPTRSEVSGAVPASTDPPSLELEQLQEAWQRSVLPAVQERAIWLGSLLGEARPVRLDGDLLTLEFAPTADFHRSRLVDEPENLELVRETLFEITGRRLTIETTLGEDAGAEDREEENLDEDEVIALIKETFGAREVEESSTSPAP
jgi:DNA polymerase-3 subunit gamma/tau